MTAQDNGEQHQHCLHECVCNKYIDYTNTGATSGRICNGETWCFKPCQHDTRIHISTSAPVGEPEQLIKNTKLRIRQLFLEDSKCELCEKVTEEDGYDGQNEGCEKGLCIECAIDKALREFAEAIRAGAIKQALAPLRAVYEKFDHLDKCLSDTEWCKAGKTSAIYGIAGEMWRAIKEATGERK